MAPTSTTRSSSRSSSRPHWSGRMAFILAAAGSAIGLGNLWKFPYLAGTHGGGVFVIVYLICIALLGLPVLISELYIGQSSQRNAVDAFEVLDRKHTPWRYVGMMGVFSAFLVLSFYSVVGGWVLDFEFRSLSDQFSNQGDDQIRGYLGGLFGDPWRQLFWHFAFLSGTIAIVIGGLKNGIEKWNKILMPILFLLLLALLVRSMFLEGFMDALKFLFLPKLDQFSGKAILEALGQSFFTLSLGLGAMLTYGSYLDKKENLIKTSLIVAVMDTSIAIVAGLVIFAVVFSFGLEPGAGPTLMFQTLPILFKKMTGTYWISSAFFLLVAFAAFTSAVSLLEVVVAYFVEHRKADRVKTTLSIGVATYLVGILTALSTNTLSDWKWGGMTFFDFFDKITSTFFMPVGGFLMVVFVGWKLGVKVVRGMVPDGPSAEMLRAGLLFLLRFFAPLAMAVFFLAGLKDF